MKYYFLLCVFLLLNFSNAIGMEKFHPGHYATLENNFTLSDLQNLLKTFGLKGVQLRYTWKSLEIAKGVYDFSKIEADLKSAENAKKFLIVFVEDKSFRGGVKYTPEYLWEGYTLPSGRSANGERGFVSKRYDDYVVERFAALMNAMAKRFDDEPWFEGVSIQESAIGLSDENSLKYGYTPEKYRDALIKILTNTKKSFQSSQVFWYMNFLAGNQTYLSEVGKAIIPHKIVMGGPDILPDSKVLTGRVYPLYEEFKDELTLFSSVQYDSYQHLHAGEGFETEFWTPEEVFLWGKENLHIDYCFWNIPKSPSKKGAYSWNDAKPVIFEYATF